MIGDKIYYFLDTDPPNSCQTIALSHLNSHPHHDLFLWTDGSVPSTFRKSVLTVCSLCCTLDKWSFSFGPVCSSVSAEAHALLRGLIWTGQHHRVCQLSSVLVLLDSSSVLSTLSSSPGFLLPPTLRQIIIITNSCSTTQHKMKNNQQEIHVKMCWL